MDEDEARSLLNDYRRAVEAQSGHVQHYGSGHPNILTCECYAARSYRSAYQRGLQLQTRLLALLTGKEDPGVESGNFEDMP